MPRASEAFSGADLDDGEAQRLLRLAHVKRDDFRDDPGDKYGSGEYEIHCAAEGCTEVPGEGEKRASMESRGWKPVLTAEGERWYCPRHASLVK
jgi:hypothetical protein